MKATPRAAFMGALYGSVAVFATLALLVALGLIPKAPYVAIWQSVAGGGWVLASVIGGALFILIGALWGVPFSLVPHPTLLKGVLFGLLPCLFGWTAIAAYMGQPLFGGFTPMGLLLPIVMNCVIWGSILGWYAQRAARPVYS